MSVRFHYADKKLNSAINKTHLKQMVANIFKTENTKYNIIDYIFCSDEYLLGINQSALNHDYYTDIITFPLHEKGKSVEAEIYISLDRVKDNALSHKNTFKQELARVIAHGALHLCGYKDKTKKDVELMRTKENHFIATIS